MMSFMYLNSRSASKRPLRFLNHKVSRLNPIYPTLSTQSKFLTPKKEVLEGRKLKCTKSSGMVILRKKPLGRLKIFSKETFPTFLEQIQVSNLSIPFLPVISGRDSFLGGGGCDTLGVCTIELQLLYASYAHFI